MTVLDRITRRMLGGATKAEPLRVATRLRADDHWEPPSEIRQEKEVSLYTKLSWIQIAVRIASQTAAATPYMVRQKAGSEYRAMPDHPFLELLARPNPLQSRFELLEATFSWRATAGNCYWWLNRPSETTPPAEVWVLPAHQVRPVPDGRLGVRGYLYDYGAAEPMPLEPWEVVHFKTWNPQDRYVGLSPIQALMLDAMGDLGSQQYNANFYSRDNAKSAGILAFADYIDEDRWRQLRADWQEQHGGTKNNRVMRLRGVGAGGVQWIPTQLSQVEIQYLEQRTFTKEQVFDMFAPGLSSVLSVNATEANSTSGKDTFLSMCVYPQHIAVSEKIDSDVLPAYGENLDGEFEDVRRVDTAQELAEQARYEATHTIDEVRKKYYDDPPLGDERGALLASDRKGEAQPVPPMLDAQDAMQQAGKALDLRRWRDKALKALAAGRACDVPFEPEYLGDEDAMRVRAALKRAQTAGEVTQAFQEVQG